jgi:predicted MPP superfamily phosphohydrolase
VIIGSALYSALDNGRVMVRRERVSISNLPPALEGFTILQVSDLSGTRFGPLQKTIRQTVGNLTYNVVCITGDSIGSAGDPAPFWELIGAFDPSKPVYFIRGDADPAYDPENPNDPYEGAMKLGARWLDATSSMVVKNQTIWLTPEGQLIENTPADALAAYRAEISNLRSRAHASSDYKAIAIAERNAAALEREIAARASISADDLHIAVMHKPLEEARAELINAWSASGDIFYRSIDAFIAGHLAGGQWRLPWLGALYVPDKGFLPEGVEGKILVSGWQQVISAGLGSSSDTPFPKFRLFNTPELTLITFTRDLDV